MPSIVGSSANVFSANSVANPTTLSPIPNVSSAVGDLLVCWTYCRSITATVATPTGWNLVSGFPKRHTSTGGGSLYVFTRIMDGTATDHPSIVWTGVATGTTGDSSSSNITTINGGTETLDGAVAFTATTSGATFTLPAITTSVANSVRLGFGAKGQDVAQTFTIGAPMTEAFEGSTTSGAGHAFETSFQLTTTAGAQGSATITGTSSTASVLTIVCSLAFQEAGGAALTQNIDDTLALADAQAKDIATFLPNEALTLADSTVVERGIAQSIADTLALADAAPIFATGKGVNIDDTLALADALAGMDVSKNLADTLILADALAKNINIFPSDPLALADALSNGFSKALSEAIPLTDALALNVSKFLSDTLTLADADSELLGTGGAALTQSIADTLALADALSRDFGIVIADALLLGDDQILDWVRFVLPPIPDTPLRRQFIMGGARGGFRR